MVICACGCNEEFEPRKWKGPRQIFKRGHRSRSNNRRMPVVRLREGELDDLERRRSVLHGFLDELLTPDETARILRVAPATVKFWRQKRCGYSGPDFIRVGGPRGEVRYHKRDLELYLRERTVHMKNGS